MITIHDYSQFENHFSVNLENLGQMYWDRSEEFILGNEETWTNDFTTYSSMDKAIYINEK